MWAIHSYIKNRANLILTMAGANYLVFSRILKWTAVIVGALLTLVNVVVFGFGGLLDFGLPFSFSAYVQNVRGMLSTAAAIVLGIMVIVGEFERPRFEHWFMFMQPWCVAL